MGWNVCKVIFCWILFCFVDFAFADVEQLSENDWRAMLQGEWLVKFYAPWCPACQTLAPTWEKLGQRSFDLNMHFAEVDVTQNPVLSGRFFITSLPTIYHVKDGVFRPYKGLRSESDIVAFVRDEIWKETEPLPWYWSPTSLHMTTVGMFFQFSITIRNVHNSMTDDYGIPVWGSYIIFALATILLGLVIGLVIVFLCDAVQSPSYRKPAARKPSVKTTKSEGLSSASEESGTDRHEEDADDFEINDEDLVDDKQTVNAVEREYVIPDKEVEPLAATADSIRHREIHKVD